MRQLIILFGFLLCLFSCENNDPQEIQTLNLQIVSVSIGPNSLSFSGNNTGLPVDQPIVFRFSQSISTNSVQDNIVLLNEAGNKLPLKFSFLDSERSISAMPDVKLGINEKFRVSILSGLKGAKGEVFPGLEIFFTTVNLPLAVVSSEIDGIIVASGGRITNIGFKPVITVYFSEKVSVSLFSQYCTLTSGGSSVPISSVQTGDSVLSFMPLNELPYYSKSRFSISANLTSEVGKIFNGFNFDFHTRLDETPKFPAISDEELLTLVQRQTFNYFWDFAHPVSGMSRERNTSGHTVTSGGSGFGIMVIIVAIERGFITREEGIERLEKIIEFLGNSERFHGAWPHWLNGATGKVVPFSSNDDGGDIVETSYLLMGLLTAREYLNRNDTRENILYANINLLWEGVNWNWYTQGRNSLTWHWSSNYGFQKNHTIRGWNEALITYILAASSPTYPITKSVYSEGWAASGMINGKEYFGITLPLGPSFGGPLFFEQYTFLGINPRNLKDQYADYFIQARNHTLINRQHCIENPYNYVGYSQYCWGLTASDGNQGYSAHSPTNDRGVISPTAAISSIPFTPEESLEALRHFYYMLGDRIWGPYGFYDAFNASEGWYGTSNIAIDQGPIIIMIENYRTGLLWELFMSVPEVKAGLTKLGFTY